MKLICLVAFIAIIVVVFADETKYSLTVEEKPKKTSGIGTINQRYCGVVIIGGTFSGNNIGGIHFGVSSNKQAADSNHGENSKILILNFNF